MRNDWRSKFQDFAELRLDLPGLASEVGFHWSFNSETGNCELRGEPEISPPIEVGKEHLMRLLHRMQGGSMTSRQAMEWANGLIMLDAFIIDPTRGASVATFLHKLAGQDAGSEISVEEAWALFGSLTDSSSASNHPDE